MGPTGEYETVRESRPEDVGGRERLVDRQVETRTTLRPVVYPGPPRPAWYENLPTWVAISIFMHGVVVLLLIVLFASPGTFGLASEGDLQTQGTPASIDARVSALERQSAALTAGAAAQSPTTQAPSTGGTVDVTTRLSALETRVAGLCAAATPPC